MSSILPTESWGTFRSTSGGWELLLALAAAVLDVCVCDADTEVGAAVDVDVEALEIVCALVDRASATKMSLARSVRQRAVDIMFSILRGYWSAGQVGSLTLDLRRTVLRRWLSSFAIGGSPHGGVHYSYEL